MPVSSSRPLSPEVSVALLSLYKPIARTPQQLFVLVRLRSEQEPEPTQQQQPVHLTVALDRSGSMQGRKIEAALATMNALVEELGPEDRFALVSFANSAEVAVRPCAMTAQAKNLVRAALAGIVAHGGTDLSGAVLLSLALGRDEVSAGPRHVIVLTDGEPTTGVTDDGQILKLAGGAMGGATLSTFGYGDDVRSELLGRLSDLGKGNYHFVEGTEPPVEAFASELGRQRSLLGVEVSLRLEVGNGVRLVYLPSFSRRLTEAPGLVELALPALLPSDSRAIVIGLEIEPQALAGDNVTPWVSAVLRYRSMADGELRAEKATLVPVLADERGAMVQEVARELVIQRAAELMREAGQRTPAELRAQEEKLAALAAEAGLGTDGAVAHALSLLHRIAEGMRSEGARKSTTAQAASMARGVYHREVTSVAMPGYSKPGTAKYAEKMRRTMSGMSGEGEKEPPKKPGEGN